MMCIGICVCPDFTLWDGFVSSLPHANLYHLSGWLRVIQKTYGHSVYNLAAIATNSGKISGVLPLVHVKHPLFGNTLVSLPFFDMGGMLADSLLAEKALLDHSLSLKQSLGASGLELRQTSQLSMLDEMHYAAESNGNSVRCRVRTHKVRMLLELPDSSESLMKSFKSKLRSQINRPTKDGLQAKSGGEELIEEFYEVFSENMRDLGSPVHAKKLIENVMAEFADRARIFVVHLNGTPLAASLVVGFNGVLENPWSSALRRYQHLSPNMLLYWKMLEYAADNDFRRFDFGRSTPGEGTFRFKQQWGAHPEPLHWHYIGAEDSRGNGGDIGRFQIAAAVWKRLPVRVSKVLGPPIRKHISL